MRYIDLKSKYEIPDIIRSLRDLVPNLSRIILPSEYETTIRELKILTVYDRFEPIMKIEGEKEVMDLFRKSFEEKQSNFKQK